MKVRPVRFGVPFDQSFNITYHPVPGIDRVWEHHMTTLWVEEAREHLVPHRFKAWFVRHGDALYGPIRGFKGPPTATPRIQTWDPMDINTPDGEVEDSESDPDYDSSPPSDYHR